MSAEAFRSPDRRSQDRRGNPLRNRRLDPTIASQYPCCASFPLPTMKRLPERR